MDTQFFSSDSFKLFVTEAPYELNGFIPTVIPDSYIECGIEENFSYYIATQTPEWNTDLISDYDFREAEPGETYKDDYNLVEVKQEGIYFTTK